MYFIDIAFHDLDYKLNKLFDHKMSNKKKMDYNLGESTSCH